MNPERAVRTRPSELPRRYFPTADVSVSGRSIPSLLLAKGDDAFEVVLHLVPGKSAPETPSLADAGAIQQALQRFLSWAALAGLAVDRSEQTAAGFIMSPDWGRLGLLKATGGTLLFTAEVETRVPDQRQALKDALEYLLAASEGPTITSPVLEGRPGANAASALTALAALLFSLDISMSIRWRSGDSTRCAMLGSSGSDVWGVPHAAPLAIGIPETATARLFLTEEEVDPLRREADPRRGGLQKLIVELRDQLVPEGERFVLTLTADQVEKVVRYFQEYGQGGFQDRLRPIYAGLYRLGISFVGLR